MIEIGALKLQGGKGTIPRSRKETKTALKKLAGVLGLELCFVIRKEKSDSYTEIPNAKAIICEGTKKEGLFPRWLLIHCALHEMVHWIQYNEGLFKDYYPRPYYGKWLWPSPQDRLRLALRAERHCDFWARRMSDEFFGSHLKVGGTIYDDPIKGAAFLRKMAKESPDPIFS
jgi:hypothetical protein